MILVCEYLIICQEEAHCKRENKWKFGYITSYVSRVSIKTNIFMGLPILARKSFAWKCITL